MTDDYEAFKVTFGDQEFYLINKHPVSWLFLEGVYTPLYATDGLKIYVDGIRSAKAYSSSDFKDIDSLVDFVEKAQKELVNINDSVRYELINGKTPLFVKKLEKVELPTIDIKRTKEELLNPHDGSVISVGGELLLKDGELYRSGTINEIQMRDGSNMLNNALQALLRKVYNDDTIDFVINNFVRVHNGYKYDVHNIAIQAKDTDTICDIMISYFGCNESIKGKLTFANGKASNSLPVATALIELYDCYWDEKYWTI